MCEAAVQEDGPTFPFCSMRCKSVDLANWLDGTYTGDDEDEQHVHPPTLHRGHGIDNTSRCRSPLL